MPRRLKLRYGSIGTGDMIYLRQCLKRVRVYLGFSPTQLAGAVGVDRKTLMGLERNRRGDNYRPDRATTLQLSAFCKRPLPPRSTAGLKAAMRELDWVATRLATAYGWEEYTRDLRRRPNKRRPVEVPEPGHHLFILDDLDDHDDAALRTPNQVECEGLLAHIRLNTDPSDLAYVESDKREALRDAIHQIRDKLNLTQDLVQEDHGVSRRTISRLENLDGHGATLPSRTTLLKLAAVCHQEGRTEDRLATGLPLDSEWHHLAAILEDAATWERRRRVFNTRARHISTVNRMKDK